MHGLQEFYSVLQFIKCSSQTIVKYLDDVNSNQLPPCDDSLRKHALRANYQAACGRCTEDGKLVVDWMDGLLKLLSSQCSRSCKLPSCSCMANGLKLSDLCHLQDCTNGCDDDDVIPDDEDDDDHDDENCCGR